MAIWCTPIACWITKATDTHSEYVNTFAFLLQQYMHERATMFRYKYLPVLFNLDYVIISELAVVQLVEAPRHKPEGSGFGFRWCHCNFALT